MPSQCRREVCALCGEPLNLGRRGLCSDECRKDVERMMMDEQEDQADDQFEFCGVRED